MITKAATLNEVVFYHRASKTLILTDTAFNFDRSFPWLTQLGAKLMGSYDTLQPSLLEKLVIEDKNQVKASIEKIFNWDFQRVNTETCACRLTVGALPRSLWLTVA